MRCNTCKTFCSTWLTRTAVLLVLGASLATATLAMSIRELRTLEKSGKQGDAYASYYLVGVMEGSVESLAQSVRNGAAPIVCLNGRRLEPQNARSLYATELQRNADLYEADMPVQLVLVNALATVYACPQ